MLSQLPFASEPIISFGRKIPATSTQCLQKQTQPKDWHRIESYSLKALRKLEARVTPQTLREWFCDELGRRGVPDRYVDAFCGRVPKSVLARRYSDYAPEKLREVYERLELAVIHQ